MFAFEIKKSRMNKEKHSSDEFKNLIKKKKVLMSRFS